MEVMLVYAPKWWLGMRDPFTQSVTRTMSAKIDSIKRKVSWDCLHLYLWHCTISKPIDEGFLNDLRRRRRLTWCKRWRGWRDRRLAATPPAPSCNTTKPVFNKWSISSSAFDAPALKSHLLMTGRVLAFGAMEWNINLKITVLEKS